MWLLMAACGGASAPLGGKASADSSATPLRPFPGSQRGEEGATTGSISILADESLRPIVEAQLDNFHLLYPNAQVRAVYAPGEAAIYRLMQSDSFRLALATRRLSKEEEAALQERQVPFRYAELATDGMLLLCQEAVPLRTLKREQLLRLLGGQAARWSDLDASLPASEIQLVFDHPASTLPRLLRDSLMEGRPLRKDQVFALGSTPEVFEYVRTRPGALGFAGGAWASDRDDPAMQALLAGLRVVEVERKEDAEGCVYEDAYFGPYQSFLFLPCYPLARKITSISREHFVGLGTGLVAYLDGPQGQRLFHKAGLAAVHTIPRKLSFPRAEGAKTIQ
jgi:phosphate transport system substrate-binding protein